VDEDEELLLLPPCGESVLRRFVLRLLRCECLLVRRDLLLFFCLRWCWCCCSNPRCCCSPSTVVREGWVPFSLSSGECELICREGSANGLVAVSSSRRRLVVSNGESEIWGVLLEVLVSAFARLLVVKLSRSR
jgi:hypothetical protein